jgi:hypothetical protein
MNAPVFDPTDADDVADRVFANLETLDPGERLTDAAIAAIQDALAGAPCVIGVVALTEVLTGLLANAPATARSALAEALTTIIRTGATRRHDA